MVGGDGHVLFVRDPGSRLPERTVATCVLDVLRTLAFPSGEGTTVAFANRAASVRETSTGTIVSERPQTWSDGSA